MKVVVVGAGISGLSSAVLLKDKGHDIEVFETREHLGGLCHDCFDDGIIFQRHGPHIFHTERKDTADFIGRYTNLYPFEHIVMARTDIGMFPIPFCKTSAEIVGELTVERIQELVFYGYSEKQWGRKWDDLPPSITNRVPKKRNISDCRYTLDKWQGVPVGGYTNMFKAMAENLTVHLCADAEDWRSQRADLIIYTGRLDKYFNYCRGSLEYRSVRFVHRIEPVRRFPIINECMAEVPWTRSTDHSHWNGNADVAKTMVTYEYPTDANCNEPLYPMEFEPLIERIGQYRLMAKSENNVEFIGRMAEHRYIDMDVAVDRALELFR